MKSKPAAPAKPKIRRTIKAPADHDPALPLPVEADEKLLVLLARDEWPVCRVVEEVTGRTFQEDPDLPRK